MGFLGDYLRNKHYLCTWQFNTEPMGEPMDVDLPEEREAGLVGKSVQVSMTFKQCAFCSKRRKERTKFEPILQYSAEQLYRDKHIEDSPCGDKIEAMCASAGLYHHGYMKVRIHGHCDTDQLEEFERAYDTGELHKTGRKVNQFLSVIGNL